MTEVEVWKAFQSYLTRHELWHSGNTDIAAHMQRTGVLPDNECGGRGLVQQFWQVFHYTLGPNFKTEYEHQRPLRAGLMDSRIDLQRLQVA